MASTIITIGEVSYQIERMDALTQGKFLKRLAPALSKFISQAQDKQTEGVELVKALVEGFGSLSDADYEFIVLNSLSRIRMIVNGVPLKNALVEQRVLVNPHMELDIIMKLINHTFNYNFQDFLAKTLSSTSDDLQRQE